MKRPILAMLGLCALAFSPVFLTAPASAQTVNCSGIPNWGTGVAYALGSLVVYEGAEYKCIQAHTSEPGWDPVDAPALWSEVGTCSSGTTSSTTGTCSAVPAAPTGLSASATTQTGTTLSWSAVTPPSNCTITGYSIYKSGTSIATTSSTSYSVTGLTAGTSYTFTVAATDSDGTGTQSASIGVTTSSASCSATPSAPTGLSAGSTTSTGTTLSWTAPTPPANCSITGYTIYKSGTSIGTSTTNSFAVTGLTASTTYSFTVAATNSDGTGSQSSAVSVTTSAASCSATPSAPTGLSAGSTTSTGTTLSWTAPTPPANCSITGYTIYKSGTSIGTSTTNSFAVTGLTASTTYSFTVAATDSDGTGSQSSAVSVTTASGGGTTCWAAWVSTTAYNGGAQVSYNGENYQAAYWTQNNNPSTNSGPAGSGEEWIPEGACGGPTCAASPAAPTGLAASSTTQTGTTLTWTAPSPPANCSITGYTIYKSGTSIGTSTTNSFAVTGLTAGTSYTFTVAATDSFGTGSQSSSISVTTLANTCTTKPSAPTGLAASGTSSSSTSLSWGAVSAPSGCTISGYTVYQGGTAIGTVSSGTTYTVTGLSASTTYSFTVAANDGAGTGSQSSSVSATTTANTSSGKGKVIGYWESWASLSLLSAATDYDVCEIAFTTSSGTDGQTQAWPATTESSSQIASDISTLHSQGKKVLISVGGASTYTIKLESSSDESSFVSSVESIVSTWNLDGVDLDIENNNLALNAGDTDINNPTTPSTIYMVQAISDLKAHFGSSFMITMAPQVADINCAGHPLGNDGAGLYWGSFIPLINKARGNITYVMTQFYNASQMYEKNGTSVVNQGTPDFDVAMADLLLSGYTIFGTGQAFPAINANQIVIGTPAVAAAAGSGYNTPTAIDQVVNYIKFGTSYGGSYTLSTTYPSLGGVMTWDMNYDNAAGYPMASAVMNDVHK